MYCLKKNLKNNVIEVSCLSLVFSFLISTGCDSAKSLDASQSLSRVSSEGSPHREDKGDEWDFFNQPESFGLPLTYTLDLLPQVGRAQITPWPETYWPAVEDGLNVRWQREAYSALEKYDIAFNGWSPPNGFENLRPLTTASCETGEWDPEYYEALGPAAKAWSDLKGNYRARNGIDDDGDGLIDECDDMDGMDLWWGSCHAWVPASILELEPQDSVLINGIRFDVSDIKALLILMYDEARQIAIGERCLESNPKRDLTGRILNPDCRNINAGTFHLLITNLVGLMGRSVGEDRSNYDEVWNQPVLGYRVLKSQKRSKEEANTLLGQAPFSSYDFNSKAVELVEVEMELDYVTESDPSKYPMNPQIDHYTRTDRYRYILELDGSGNVIGGEWIAQRDSNGEWSLNDRPDYIWLPLGAGRLPIDFVDSSQIRELHRRSRAETRYNLVKTYRSVVDQLIPDWPKSGLSNTITVTDHFVAKQVIVHFSIAHDFIYDLSVKLVRQQEEIVLFSRRPEGSLTSIVASVELPEFEGQDTFGEWTLVATDHNARSLGRFFDWSLEFTAAP